MWSIVIVCTFFGLVMLDFAIYISPFFLIPAVFLFHLAIKYRPRKHLPPRNPSSDYGGGYEGCTHGDIVNLGGGQCVDLRDPGSIVDGVNWREDNYGNYYNSATGESIDYNNGCYRYHDGSDDNSNSYY